MIKFVDAALAGLPLLRDNFLFKRHDRRQFEHDHSVKRIAAGQRQAVCGVTAAHVDHVQDL